MPVTLPILVVVSGPAGTGKTTLAHRLAAAIGCPAICRDEIKEGMVLTERPASASRTRGAPAADARRVLRRSCGSSSSMKSRWSRRPRFRTTSGVRVLPRWSMWPAIRIVQCHAVPATAWERLAARGDARGAHDDRALLEMHGSPTRFYESFVRVALDAAVDRCRHHRWVSTGARQAGRVRCDALGQTVFRLRPWKML